eukprot:scaffold277823_cov45-Attheya_sp.AAC.3
MIGISNGLDGGNHPAPSSVPKASRHPTNTTAGSAFPMPPLGVPRPMTALKLWQQEQSCNNQGHGSGTGRRPRLNLLLGEDGEFGCLDLGITEIAGAAGCGKTQMSLSLCVSCACALGHSSITVASPEPNILSPLTTARALQNSQSNQVSSGRSKTVRNPYSKQSSTKNIGPQNSTSKRYKALYVSMGEGCTPSQIAHRLSTMVEGRRQMEIHRNDGDVMSRILTRYIRNEEEFLALVQNELPQMLRVDNKDDDDDTLHEGNQHKPRIPIGIIVLDSMAGLFRLPEQASGNTNGSPFFAQRSGLLFQVAAKLKQLSHQYDVPVVIINQVTSVISNDTSFSKNNDNVIPALGLSWTSCVNTRYVLSRRETTSSLATPSNIRQSSSSSTPTADTRTHFVRTIQVRLSSRLSSSKAEEFQIQKAGTTGVAL